MTLFEIEQWYNKVVELLRQHRVFEAIEFIAKRSNERFQPAIDELKYTYNNILAYTGKGINDPMGPKIYAKLISSVYELTDSMKLFMLSGSGGVLAAMKSDMERQSIREHEDLSENLMGLSFDNELQDILRSVSLFDDESESETARNHRQAISRAFLNLWLMDKFSENDEQVVVRIFNSSSIPWFEKSMMVSAITLGIIRVFDLRRIKILIDLYSHPDAQISQRALFGILVSMMIYDKRFQYYPDLDHKLTQLSFLPTFKDDLLNVFIQFIRARDTEKVTKRFQDEILPEVIRFNQDLTEKLDLDKLIKSSDPIDKNPDWEKYFDSQPGLMRKLEELTNMQMEGVDVFLSAFANLKSFPFFKEHSNWFMPFYPENYAVQESLISESDTFRDVFLKGLNMSMYMCNSDKFSFAFNIRFMPDQQKDLMVQMFEGENEQLAELKNEELSDPSLLSKRITIQYIQDVYRFFKINPLRNELTDIFVKQIDLQDLSVITRNVTDADFYRTIAYFYFDNNHFEEALKLFDYLISIGGNYAELYEKAGYCYQKTGRFHQAINLYKRADLFDTNHNWILRKLAQCYLALDDSNSTLGCYLELNNLEPDNESINASIGSCYLNMDQPEKALDYFYRIEFLRPDSLVAMRPIAWCLFLLRRNTEADRYYNNLIASDPNTYDYLNAGHVAFALGHKEKAIQLYMNSIRTRPEGIKSFIKSYNKDRKHLLLNDVEPSEIALMLDYLRFGKSEGLMA